RAPTSPVPLAREGVRRWFRHGLADLLEPATEQRAETGRDGLGTPAAVLEGGDDLVRVRPQCEPVTADADRLARDLGGLVGGEEGDESGDVVGVAEAQHPARPRDGLA